MGVDKYNMTQELPTIINEMNNYIQLERAGTHAFRELGEELIEKYKWRKQLLTQQRRVEKRMKRIIAKHKDFIQTNIISSTTPTQ